MARTTPIIHKEFSLNVVFRSAKSLLTCVISRSEMRLCCMLLVGVTCASAQNALEVIEGVRGGRHWVDAKTDPPKSPQETLATLHTS